MKRRVVGLVRKRAELVHLLQRQTSPDHDTPLRDHLQTEQNQVDKDNCDENTRGNSFEKYSVLWGKPSTRKHKKWEGDGILEVTKDGAKLYNEDKQLLSSRNSPLVGPLLGQIVMYFINIYLH